MKMPSEITQLSVAIKHITEPTKLSIVGKQKRCRMKTEHLEKVPIAGLAIAFKN